MTPPGSESGRLQGRNRRDFYVGKKRCHPPLSAAQKSRVLHHPDDFTRSKATLSGRFVS